MPDKPADRRSISFAQAEGVDPMPSQLALRTISKELRLALWDYWHQILVRAKSNTSYDIVGPVHSLMRRKHVYFDQKPADEFKPNRTTVSDVMKATIFSANYVQVYGLMEFLVRNGGAHHTDGLNNIFEEYRAPYRIVDGSVVPFASEHEGQAIQKAFLELRRAGLDAAREHLKASASHLSSGDFAASIRESMHAVESVARKLDGSAELSKALARLEKSAGIHAALKRGFSAIYGYTSDEKGIRHPLIDDPNAKVDESDALFMIGACASFVTYLIGKSRTAGILDDGRS